MTATIETQYIPPLLETIPAWEQYVKLGLPYVGAVVVMFAVWSMIAIATHGRN